MEMDTTTIWSEHHEELYFFILKKVKEQDRAEEVLQNSFLKIHNNLHKLKREEKVRAWVFQIVRNEINNFFKQQQRLIPDSTPIKDRAVTVTESDPYCCFERFIASLPKKYHPLVEQVYLQGKTQQKAAEELGISLANAKARIRRAKELLKENFQKCCNYEIDTNGQLSGEPDCGVCNMD